MHPGAKLDFASPEIHEEWLSDVDPWLRPVLLVACLLYHEAGANRCRIVKILGDDNPYKYGRSADLSVLTIPSVRSSGKDSFYIQPAWISTRINILFPYGDGEKTTADYDGCVIKIEIPSGGYRRDAKPLHCWSEWGNTGRILTPRRVRI